MPFIVRRLPLPFCRSLSICLDSRGGVGTIAAHLSTMTDNADKTDRPEHRPFALVALLLAWLIPGAGHFYLRQTGRGVIIFLVIGATFWSGVAIGGVMTMDYHNERWWFAAEMLTGVHGLISWRRQNSVYHELAADAEVGVAPHPRSQARLDWQYRLDKRLAADGLALVSPTSTVARAYCGVAGLMNLMCAFDAVMLCLIGATGPQPPGSKKGSQKLSGSEEK